MSGAPLGVQGRVKHLRVQLLERSEIAKLGRALIVVVTVFRFCCLSSKHSAAL